MKYKNKLLITIHSFRFFYTKYNLSLLVDDMHMTNNVGAYVRKMRLFKRIEMDRWTWQLRELRSVYIEILWSFQKKYWNSLLPNLRVLDNNNKKTYVDYITIRNSSWFEGVSDFRTEGSSQVIVGLHFWHDWLGDVNGVNSYAILFLYIIS